MGRAGRTPCCSKAIAAASTAPIQMGRYRSPCVSLSSRIGWLPGSSTRTPTTRSSCTVRLPGRRSVDGSQASGGGLADDVHGTPESGAEQFPQPRLEQCGVQLRRQGGEVAELLGGARPGLLRPGPQDGCDQLLDQSRLPLDTGPVDPQVTGLDAVA